MNKDVLKQIILDQKEMYLNNKIVVRDYSLDESVNYCFVGIRRTGKSYMIYNMIKGLLDKGITNVVYLNFEDERLIDFETSDFNLILELAMETSDVDTKPYLFLDEVQNVAGWEKFARRVADLKYHISITGSNSKMLSGEIASTLGGRFMIVQIFPYSFREYLKALGEETIAIDSLTTTERAKLMNIYDEYVKYGSFPEIIDTNNKKDYLTNIYQIIYIGDIITRNNISNRYAIRLILKKISEAVMKPISYSRLTNILKSVGLAIGKQTVINYIQYMLESYLLFKVENFPAKIVDRESTPKYYFMDSGLLGVLLLDSKTKQLENLVAIELYRRYGIDNVFYYENNNVDIDFFLPNEQIAIQVSYDNLDDYDTKERELGSFVRLAKYMPEVSCILITNTTEENNYV